MEAPPLNDTKTERGITPPVDDSSNSSDQHAQVLDNLSLNTFFGRLNARITAIQHLEARGIACVPEDQRHKSSPSGYLQIALLWFSVNLSANNLAVGILGPLIWELSFLDSALCAVFGGVLGGVGTGLMSTFGPASGNRTMVIARYFMGYYPAKITCVLNIIIMLGYGMIDCLVGGQILSAVSGGSLSVVIPQLMVLMILAGSAGPKFDTLAPSIASNQETLNANRLSFFSLCFSAPVAWVPSSADYLVYYPTDTNKKLVFLMVTIGFALSYTVVYVLGIGLATAALTHPAWAAAKSVSSGALILQGYNGLGGFGKFCAVVVSLGVIANNIPGTYSAALAFQVLGEWNQKIPRWLLTSLCVLIYTACALGGRNNLYDIFENFLALMGYWSCFFLAIVMEEHLIFRRKRGYDWTQWSDRKALPMGIAALIAFLVGWAGAIVSMDQVWYVGPIAKLCGDYGADLGIWVGTSWTLLVFPPLRVLELSKIGR